MRTRGLLIIAMAAALAGGVSPVPAQVVVRVAPRAALLTPADWFYEEYAHFGVQPLEWTRAAILRSAMAGAAVEVELPALGLWARAEVARTVGGRTWVEHAWLRPPVGFEPATVIRTWYHVPTSLTAATLELGLPTRLRLPAGIQPYITAGVGAKRYGFDTAGMGAAPENIILPQPGTRPSLSVGGGAVVDVGGVRLDLVVRDAISTYWDRLQHDVSVSLGGWVRVAGGAS